MTRWIGRPRTRPGPSNASSTKGAVDWLLEHHAALASLAQVVGVVIAVAVLAFSIVPTYRIGLYEDRKERAEAGAKVAEARASEAAAALVETRELAAAAESKAAEAAQRAAAANTQLSAIQWQTEGFKSVILSVTFNAFVNASLLACAPEPGSNTRWLKNRKVNTFNEANHRQEVNATFRCIGELATSIERRQLRYDVNGPSVKGKWASDRATGVSAQQLDIAVALYSSLDGRDWNLFGKIMQHAEKKAYTLSKQKDSGEILKAAFVDSIFVNADIPMLRGKVYKQVL